MMGALAYPESNGKVLLWICVLGDWIIFHSTKTLSRALSFKSFENSSSFFEIWNCQLFQPDNNLNFLFCPPYCLSPYFCYGTRDFSGMFVVQNAYKDASYMQNILCIST